MRLSAVTILSVITAVAFASGCRGEPSDDRGAAPSEHVLVGQLLLPPGSGSRGVEVVVTVADAESEPRDIWVLFDEDGRFSSTIQGSLTRVTVSTGLRAELHRIETGALPEINEAGRIDVGVIDLRERLFRHRLELRAAEGSSRLFGPYTSANLPSELRID